MKLLALWKPPTRTATLKKRAAHLWRGLNSKLDSVNCGRSLLRVISPEYADMEDEFESIIRELAKTDPDAQALLEKFHRDTA